VEVTGKLHCVHKEQILALVSRIENFNREEKGDIMKTFAIFCLLFGLLGASAAFAEKSEKLLGMSTDFDGKTLTIEVASSGCTSKGSFRLDFKNNTLTVYRIDRDACKAMPSKVKFTYSLEEAGINPHKPFKVGNSFIVNENLAGL
jgi:hypothetical protein